MFLDYQKEYLSPSHNHRSFAGYLPILLLVMLAVLLHYQPSWYTCSKLTATSRAGVSLPSCLETSMLRSIGRSI